MPRVRANPANPALRRRGRGGGGGATGTQGRGGTGGAGGGCQPPCPAPGGMPLVAPVVGAPGAVGATGAYGAAGAWLEVAAYMLGPDGVGGTGPAEAPCPAEDQAGFASRPRSARQNSQATRAVGVLPQPMSK